MKTTKRYLKESESSMNKVSFCLVLLISTAILMAETSLSADQIRQKLLAQPPQTIAIRFQKLAARGISDPIEINSFVPADLDGSGTFSYVVALYSINNTGGFLRVFKKKGTDLVVAGDEEDNREVGGFSEKLQLVDVNGDGIPEIQVVASSSDGQQEFFSLYAWTGSGLHNMLPNLQAYGDFADLDGNGILAIVIPKSTGDYDVYKLEGNTYKFFKNFSQDPTGQTDSNGQYNHVEALCSTLEPYRFSLFEIEHALREDHDGDRHDAVELIFGGLKRVHGGAVDVNQVDIHTITVAPHLTPTDIKIQSVVDKDDNKINARKEQHSCHHTSHIKVYVSRSSFLKGLQRLHLNGPLASGDKIEVKLSAKLTDGTPLDVVFRANVVADDDDKDHNRNDHQVEEK